MRKNERTYLSGFEVYREYGGNGTSVTLERETLHVMDDKQRITLVETRTLDTAGNDPTPPQLIHYQFGNHLGSTSLELDDQARIVSYEEYYPYGSTSYQSVHSQTEAPKRYCYSGKERDEESGFYYYGARYYAPWLGRWTSSDPAEMVDGPNLYTYARSNPIRFTDPTGTEHKHPEMVKRDSEYTVRSNPEKMFGENYTARQNWIRAMNETLEREFGLGSQEKNFAAYEKWIDSLNDGPQQIGKRLNLSSKSGFARSMTNKVLAGFYKNESRNPSWPYSDTQKELLEKGHAPDPLQQLEHLDNLAKNQKGAIDVDNVYLTEGGKKGGIPRGSPHWEKHHGESGERLRAFNERIEAETQATFDSPESTPQPLQSSAPAPPRPSDSSPMPGAGAGVAVEPTSPEAPPVEPTMGVADIAFNGLLIGAQIVDILIWRYTSKKYGYVDVSGQRIVTDPSKIRDYTPVRNFDTGQPGQLIGGRFVEDPL